MRPSIRTSSLLAAVELNPRAEIAQLPGLNRATSRPGTRRSSSGILVAPDLRISSVVIRVIAAAVWPSGSALRETDVTSTSINSSSVSFLKSVCGVF